MKPENESEPSCPEAQFCGLPKQITALLEKESDRGVILILAAYLEETLALIVRASCTTDGLGKKLLEYRAPAGDFSSKIALCEAFGSISAEEAHALHVIRSIRNSAAHFDDKGRGFEVLFDSPKTLDQVRAFIALIGLKLNSTDPAYARELFITTGRFLAARMYIRCFFAKRPPAPRSIKEIAAEWKAIIQDTPEGIELAEAEQLAKDGNLKKLMDLTRARMEALSQFAAALEKQKLGSKSGPI